MKHHWLKEDNSEKFAYDRIIGIVCLLYFLAYAGYGLYITGKPDPTFGTQLMAVMIGVAGLVAGRQLTQKDSSQLPPQV